MRSLDEEEEATETAGVPRGTKAAAKTAALNNIKIKGARIDARIPSPENARGERNIHRDTDGTVIGAVRPDGTGYGTRSRGGFPVDGSRLGHPTTPGLDKNAEMNAKPAAAPLAPPMTTAAPTGSQLLKDRQRLHQEMVQAGQGGISQGMEARAAQLGVQPGSFRRVAAAIPPAPASLVVKPAASPVAGAVPAPMVKPAKAVQAGARPFVPGNTPEPGLTPQIATRTPGALPQATAGGPRVNRLTGKPLGWLPGDKPRPASTTPSRELAQTGADVQKIINRPDTIGGPSILPKATDFKIGASATNDEIREATKQRNIETATRSAAVDKLLGESQASVAAFRAQKAPTSFRRDLSAAAKPLPPLSGVALSGLRESLATAGMPQKRSFRRD